MSDEQHIQSGRDTIKAEGDVVQVAGDYILGNKTVYQSSTPKDRLSDVLSWINEHVESNISPTDRRLLAERVLSCSSFPYNRLENYRSLESLVYFLVINDQDQEAKQRLLNAVESIFGYCFPFMHLNALVALLSQVELEVGTIKDLYRRSAPSGQRWRLPDIQDPNMLLEHILYRLAKANYQHDGSYPLMDFVSRLTGLVTTDKLILAPIIEWLRETEIILGLESGRHQNDVENTSPMADEATIYLMIRVEPRDREFYAQTAWFGSEKRQIYPETVEDEKAVSVEEIEQIVQRLHAKVIRGLIGELIIEIFLPSELLDFASDLLKIRQGKYSQFILGEKYQLVSRSYDRIYDPIMHETHYDWRRRWNLWKSALDGHSHAAPCWLNSEEDHHLDRLMGDDTISFLVFKFVPSVSRRDELFSKALDAGIPVILLPRKQNHTPSYIERVLDELCHDGYGLMRKKLKILRWQAIEEMKTRQEQDHIDESHGLHLTLIWDDPERLPPGSILY